jgi:hypothetical protein
LPAFDEISNGIHAPERHNTGRAIRFPPSAVFPLVAGHWVRGQAGNGRLFDLISLQAVNAAMLLISIR